MLCFFFDGFDITRTLRDGKTAVPTIARNSTSLAFAESGMKICFAKTHREPDVYFTDVSK